MIKEAVQMFLRARRVKKHGFKEYKGKASQICKQIVKDCWNKTLFCASAGHFNVFYMRDFGMCVEALLKLGYKKEVWKTLQFALTVYSREKKLTTTITAGHKPVDYFAPAPDTLPFLIHSLKLAKAKDLVEIYKPFIEKEIDNYYNKFIEPKSGLIHARFFSSIKDQAKRRTSCYDICMAGMLSKDLDELKLANPLKQYNYEELLKNNFWNGKYFEDALFDNFISGDANVFPYWCGIIKDKKMLKSSIAAIQKNNLDEPFPLKYTSEKKARFLLWSYILSPNYEGTTIWTHLGLCYLDVLSKADKKLMKKYLSQYEKHIEKHKTFLEVFNQDGSVYETPFYIADEGMLWASKYAYLSKI